MKAGASTVGSRVIALGDGPRGREPLDIFGIFLSIFWNIFSDTLGIFQQNILEYFGTYFLDRRVACEPLNIFGPF